MGRKIAIGAVVTVIILAIAGLLIWLLVDLNVNPKFEITDNKLIVHDTYKAEIDLTDAEIVMSSDKLELTKRVVGTSTRSLKKGRFIIKDEDNEVYLSMVRFGEEYIFIKCGEERYYINLQTSAETIELYNKLLEKNKR